MTVTCCQSPPLQPPALAGPPGQRGQQRPGPPHGGGRRPAARPPLRPPGHGVLNRSSHRTGWPALCPVPDPPAPPPCPGLANKLGASYWSSQHCPSQPRLHFLFPVCLSCVSGLLLSPLPVPAWGPQVQGSAAHMARPHGPGREHTHPRPGGDGRVLSPPSHHGNASTHDCGLGPKKRSGQWEGLGKGTPGCPVPVLARLTPLAAGGSQPS